MKRHGTLILVAAATAVTAAGCSPSYTSGKTQCSTKKECPSGFSCSDDGTSNPHYCIENKNLGCPAASTFYCSQSLTCWAKPGACSTVTSCATAKHTGYLICELPNYHPDCNGDSCLPNGTIGSGGRDGGAGGAIGTGGASARGGAGGTTATIIGYGGATAYGGSKGYGGTVGYGGSRDAGLEAGVVSTGGARDAGPPIGGIYLTGGTVGRGGAGGTGGYYATGGSTGSSLCWGTPDPCAYKSTIGNCKLANGCVWNATTATCSGTALSCSSYTTSTWCYYNGCIWQGALTCNASVMTPYCSSLMAPDDDACTTCTLTACCAQVTACINDTTCINDQLGAWNSYADCLINCCGSASACNWY